MGRNRTLAIIEALAAVLIWGASFAATKIALAEGSPVTIVWLRFAMGVIVLGVATHWRGELRKVSLRDLLTFAGLGFLGITLHQWLQSNSLVTTHASTGGWVAASTPIFIALLAAVALREHLTLLQWGGIILAFLGVLMVVTKGSPSLLLAGRLGEPGDFLMVLSAPNWAVFSVLSRRTLRDHPAARMIFYTMALGWIFTSMQFFTSGRMGEMVHFTLRAWLAIGFLGVFCSGLAYIFWYDALQHAPASEVGVFLNIEPLVAVATGAFFLAEPILAATIVGGGVILMGVWMVNRSRQESIGPSAGVS